mgnify:FL=1
MKKIVNTDGTIDYSYTSEEFFCYMVGCLIYVNDKEVLFRVKGEVKDYKEVIVVNPDFKILGFNIQELGHIINFAIQHGYKKED